MTRDLMTDPWDDPRIPHDDEPRAIRHGQWTHAAWLACDLCEDFAEVVKCGGLEPSVRVRRVVARAQGWEPRR